jgi:hypothetical protein
MLPIQLLIFCCLIFVIGGIMSEPKASVPGGELKLPCGLCKGTGKTYSVGFTSAGDAGNKRPAIEHNCSICNGKGWVYLSADELTEMLAEARKKIEQAEELLRRSCPFLYCDSGCGCEGHGLYKEIKLFLAPPAQKAEIKE